MPGAKAALGQPDMRHKSFIVGLVALVVFSLTSQLATAADRALAVPVGYSQDGRYFSFEEFGVQDGSGLAFSSYYMIDLRQDVWVVGTPIREVAEDESISLPLIRERAGERAKQVLMDLGIDKPANLLAANGDGEPGNDGSRITYGLPGPGGPDKVRGRIVLSLSTFETPAGSPCREWFNVEALGYQIEAQVGDRTATLFRDRELPRSRGCPAAYRISAVYVPFNAVSTQSAVALISVYAHGFEGLDRRFLALPLAKAKLETP